MVVKVFVIGGTGVLGRPAVRQLLAAGHEVRALARNAERAEVIRGLGARPVIADLFDLDQMTANLAHEEAVINLATRIPSGISGARRKWQENERIRNEASAIVVQAALRSQHVRVLVQEGVSFLYADGGDAELREDAPLSVPPGLESVMRAHANAERFATAGAGRSAIRLRISRLLGDDALTRFQVSLTRRGIPVVFGDPDGWTSVVYPDDAASAAIAALDAPSGVYNVAADPVRKRELGALFARAARVRKARALPGWLASRMGRVSIFARSQRVVSDSLTAATGWRPERPVPTLDWFPQL
ncbi:nucleoside-diphosphate sugar epimerase [Longimycelium tulufanense]|uniref:Nucleoside-diphosphate sugar epimerase n=1 Tax=Longimycelium tulufanense TaxID=907463 RepID=A0A8J3CHZ4_9PSEU|nr:NAD(P)H-binding protein [Longimycelium tulufanense]GGM80087.1 nucleoside-diphosphate sugar epimerase [Longimycelium tulufanense]